MPDVFHALQGTDLGFLRIVAEIWGVDLPQPDAAAALPVLAHTLNDPALLREVLDTLPTEDLDALRLLMKKEGKMGWSEFCRRFGELRSMGPGKRDRERPDLNPVSITERLWYHALIGRAFFNIPPEPQEFAYIPEDLFMHMTYLQPAQASLPAQPATAQEVTHILPADDHILDHACTLLAALRCGMPLEPFERRWSIPASILLGLLQSAALVDNEQHIQTEAVRQFLEAPRAVALLQLAQSWLHSASFNDLRCLPGLVFEGQWDNHPYDVRRLIFDSLQQLPPNQWWTLSTLVDFFHENQPDFQRPGGDYESWFIRTADTDFYLRGFDSWDRVDGALIRFLISGPLHWLGWVDLAHSAANRDITAFRPSTWAEALTRNTPPEGLPEERQKIKISPDGRLRMTTLVPRTVRYQVARFCEWESELPQETRFRLTPASLQRAAQQGLRTNHLLALLKRHAAAPLAPSLLLAFDRCEKFGAQANLESAILLRLSSPEQLIALQKSRAARYLKEILNSTTVSIQPGRQEAVRQALADAGYLIDDLPL